MIRRREFIRLASGAAAWPISARAQQPAGTPIVGFLGGMSPEQVPRSFGGGLSRSGSTVAFSKGRD
jgi:hypothetical protein